MIRYKPYLLSKSYLDGVTPVNTEAANELTPIPSVNKAKDRHKPGYMAAYMRKRRAK